MTGAEVYHVRSPCTVQKATRVLREQATGATRIEIKIIGADNE